MEITLTDDNPAKPGLPEKLAEIERSELIARLRQRASASLSSHEHLGTEYEPLFAAAADALTLLPEWSGISTAPDEGSFMVGLWVHDNRSNSDYWDQHIVWLDDETGEIHADADQGWRLEDYTHWMPLPPPPVTDGGKEISSYDALHLD